MHDLQQHHPDRIYGTTIVCVLKDGCVAMAGDGQVSLGNTVMKSTARKVRRIETKDKTTYLVGFAGATADAFSLSDALERKLEAYPQSLLRACVELAKEWRKDKYLQKLEAMLLVADRNEAFLVSGSGDIIEPEEGLLAIGSGGMFALSAARAMKRHADSLTAAQIAEQAIKVAGEICVYTNHNITLESLVEDSTAEKKD